MFVSAMSLTKFDNSQVIDMFTRTVTQQFEETFEEKPVEKEKSTFRSEEIADPVPELPEKPVHQQIIWRNVIGIGLLHLIAIRGFVTGYNLATVWTWVFSESDLFYQ